MIQSFTIDGKRMEERLKKLSEMGQTKDGGVHRMALSEDDFQAQELVAEWMRQAGMTVRRDHFCNLIGRREGKGSGKPVIMMGSHIDSVPNGGRFDGTIGVIGAIEAVQAIHDAGLQTEYPIEVVAFCDEEGPRFSGGLFGSQGMVGRIQPGDLQKKDAQGITRYEALKRFDLNPDRMADSIRIPGEIKVYLEMHIEQGPYLESINEPVGIVTGIAGPAWIGVKVKGEAGHAGTVPMHLRKDPMVGAAEIILAIHRICGKDPSAPTVGTVGKIQSFPGGSNVIPEGVEFTVDIRDIDLSRRDRVMAEIRSAIDEICGRYQLQVEIEENMNVLPVECSDHVVKAMQEASESLGLQAPKMVSGAGHDAMLLADIADMGMIFVRCRNGISHSPKEWAETEDIVKGTKLLLGTVLNYV
ncbi:M20 family metallo-hydrolase [Ammoniphilus sp. YIM 78166]|uniref:M20 family metallo-hydrolase n=1 Tax=Ammoniphilus sp. YIM 78166 TaxID=1644106 RepID=UPI00106F51E0|nr:M20 family metallo-hydrolase [Ammoniphilus sp. YIM 78166]